jgi:SPX domain protein involved in polyphosphate accumulation
VARFERLELKYVIDELRARIILSEILPYCRPDPHNPPEAGLGYDIFSLYLETPSYSFYRAKMRNEPDRIKLRARTYSTTSPVHLEVKRKCVEVIEKTRAAVKRRTSHEVLRGYASPIDDTPTQRSYIERFAYFSMLTGARPMVLVRYDREAYVSSVDRYARITFDRHVVAQRVDTWDLVGQESAWTSVAGRWFWNGAISPVLLELKCETVMPHWMSRLIRRHDLRAQGFSKYCRGLEASEGMLRGIDASPTPRGAFV